MKQVQIIIRPKKLDEIMSALRKADVGGLTLSSVKGMGRADPPLVGETYSREQIVVITTDEKVKDIFDTVSEIACTGKKGDGKIFKENQIDQGQVQLHR